MALVHAIMAGVGSGIVLLYAIMAGVGSGMALVRTGMASAALEWPMIALE